MTQLANEQARCKAAAFFNLLDLYDSSLHTSKQNARLNSEGVHMLLPENKPGHMQQGLSDPAPYQ